MLEKFTYNIFLPLVFLQGNWLSLQIAVEKFSEATVGYRDNKEIAEQWVQLFSTPYFMVTPVSTIDVLFLSSFS